MIGAWCSAIAARMRTMWNVCERNFGSRGRPADYLQRMGGGLRNDQRRRRRRGPLASATAQIEGAYVATGHNVWGILNAPATGEALAELIVDGFARPFDP